MRCGRPSTRRRTGRTTGRRPPRSEGYRRVPDGRLTAGRARSVRVVPLCGSDTSREGSDVAAVRMRRQPTGAPVRATGRRERRAVAAHGADAHENVDEDEDGEEAQDGGHGRKYARAEIPPLVAELTTIAYFLPYSVA